MNQSEQINELAAALAKAQGEITPALKDSNNPFFKSKYADLSNIWGACKAALSKNGLSVLQTLDDSEDRIILITTLAHSSGQWMRSKIRVTPTKNDAQGIGSAITYMRRYSLAAMVGVTTEDDDGNAACEPTKQEAKQDNKQTKYISQIQAIELKNLLTECDESYRSKFWEFLKKEFDGLDKLEHLPAGMYDRIKSAISKKREENEKLVQEKKYA